jgi:signal transduction histidine kinase
VRIAWGLTAIGGLVTLNVGEIFLDTALGVRHVVPGTDLPPTETGRMALVTAIGTVLAVTAAAAASRRRRRAQNVLGTLSLAVGVVALVGYAIGARDLYTVGDHSTVALPTALAITAAATAALLWSPASTLHRLLADRGSAGSLMRVVLPVLVAAAVLVGRVLLEGQVAGWYDVYVMAAVMTAATTAISVAVLVPTALQLERAAIREEAARRSEERLRTERAEAEAANRAKSEFLSRMSHELRTPLNAVLGFGQLLELDDLPAEQREAVDHILRSGRHLVVLLDEVLQLSRLEAGSEELVRVPLKLSDLALVALHGVADEARTRCVHLTLEEPQPPEPEALGDPDAVAQVLGHLVRNAVGYNVTGGEVRLRVEAHDAHCVRVVVQDTGPGVPEERRHLLFVPFERLGAERGVTAGTGMGLALSRHLAMAMGGALDLETGPGGSTFWLDLPRS